MLLTKKEILCERVESIVGQEKINLISKETIILFPTMYFFFYTALYVR